jgi:hypothetical protein
MKGVILLSRILSGNVPDDRFSRSAALQGCGESPVIAWAIAYGL